MPVLIAVIFFPWPGAWEYIESTRDMVRDLERCVRLAKVNVETAIDIMAKWCQKPLYQRKEDKKDSLLNLEVFPHMHVHSCMADDFPHLVAVLEVV